MSRVKQQAKKRSSVKLIKSPLGKSTPVSKKKKSVTPNKSNISSRVEGSSRRRKPGRKALQEIRHYQRTTMNLIPRLPFCRLVKEIITNECAGRADFRIQALALEALQTATEAFIVRFLEEANLVAIHARRVTLMPKDFELLKKLKYSTEIVQG